MSTPVYTEKNVRILEITVAALVVFMMAFGVICQVMEWRLPGVTLTLVGGALVNLLNAQRSRASLLSARLADIERRLG